VGIRALPRQPLRYLVTEKFDRTRSQEDLRKAVREGEGWLDAMTASLVRLELPAKAGGQRDR
jgi:hypothetical protein